MKNKLADACKMLNDVAKEIPAITICIDTVYDGNIHIEWHGVLDIEIPPKDVPTAIDAIRTLTNLGMDTFQK